MTERPPVYYVLLWFLCLAVWVMGDPQRLLWAILAGGLILPAYFVKKIYRPGVLGIAMGSSVVFFFELFVIYGDSNPDFVAIYNMQYIHPLCATLLILGMAQWYLERSKRFDWLLLTLGFFLVFSTIDWQVSEHKSLYLWVALLWVFVWIMARTFWSMYAPQNSSSLRRYQTFQALILVVLTGSFSLGGILLSEYIEKQYKDSFTEMLMPNKLDWSGFSGYTKLSGNREIQLSNDIALKIKTDIPREYLRGIALVHYKEGQWFPSGLPSPPFLHKGKSKGTENAPQTPPLATSLQVTNNPLWRMEITKSKAFDGVIFAPPNTLLAYIDPTFQVMSNPYFNLKVKKAPKEPFQYVLEGQRLGDYQGIITHKVLEENLQIPNEVRQKLAPLAKELTLGLKSPEEKAQAITLWFQKHFTYSLKIGAIPKDEDPTTHFVLFKKPGYCSWFASGLTLMLRSIDIPAHVMSGWRNMEYHRLSGQWIVREKEAHNWVEVLTADQTQWKTFDPTPPAQFESITGSGQKAGVFVQLKEAIILFFQTLRGFFQGPSVASFLELLRVSSTRMLSSAWFYVCLALFLGLNQWLKSRKKSPIEAGQGVSHRQEYAGLEKLAPLTERLFALLAQTYPDVNFRALTVAEIQAHVSKAPWTQALNNWRSLRFGHWDEGAYLELLTFIDTEEQAQHAAQVEV